MRNGTGLLALRRRRLLAGALGALGARGMSRLGGGLSALGAVAACSPLRPGQDEFETRHRAEIDRFAQHAYHGAEEQVGEESRDSWLANGEELEVSILMPLGPGPFPLVIYLPGFAESAADGTAWRRAFAAAGYAVIGMQTPGAGRQVHRSGQARAGNLADLARAQFAADALAARHAAVRAALAEASRRSAARQPPFGAIDLSRIAVVGFELGAQTAQLFAGEQYPGLDLPPPLPELKSVIAISPHANPAGGDFSKRFAGMRLPVLSVTGVDDVDDWGIVTTGAARQAPFRNMPPGGKYLLALDGATHKMLAGKDEAPGESAGPGGDDEEAPERRVVGGPDGESTGRRPGRGGRPNGPGGGFGEAGASRGGPGGGMGGGRPPAGGFPGGRAGSGRGATLRVARMRIAICIRSVTTAFLDASVKDDPVAGEWLQRNAPRWLNDWGVYQSK